jgi:hypothetical protein
MKNFLTLLALWLLFGLPACQAPGFEAGSPLQAPTAGATAQAEAAAAPGDENALLRFDDLAQAEKAAGFELHEPGFLPEGVSLDFVVFQPSPSPSLLLQYKIVHPEYGDRGAFFQILVAPQAAAPADTTGCPTGPDGSCEVLQNGDQVIVYHLYAGGTEGLDWFQDGLAFRLLRTAGEPGKVYKDDLLKVVESMK